MKLKWQQAPVKTQWGDEMVVASVAIDKDHTVDLYCERDQAPKVDAMFAQRSAEQPAQQQGPVTIGEPVGWHSKQYGFVYMALQPHQFEVGSTLCLKNGTPAWRIESSCSKTALISMSSLPHGTVFYTSPPAQRKPLTDEQIRNIWSNGDCFEEIAFARAIEAAHGIKENT